MRVTNAIKLLRAEENRVPRLKFIFTRTSSCCSEDNQILSPLESRLNPTFKLNNLKSQTEQIIRNDGMRALPDQTKQITNSLGLNSAYLFTKLRAKEIANEIDVALNTKTTVDIEVQTLPFVCDTCERRNRREFINRGTQVFEARKDEIGIQTDVEEYRDPLAKMMARLSSTQLKAVRDFASLMLLPEPQSPAEMAKLRDDVLDVYYSQWGNGRLDDYPDRGRHHGDMDQRMNNMNMNMNMNDYNRGGGGNGGHPRIPHDCGGPNMGGGGPNMGGGGPNMGGIGLNMGGGGPMNNDYGGNNYGPPNLDNNCGYENDHMLARQMEEEHMRQQELIQREEMERQRMILLNEEAERREQDMRFEQDLMDFNRNSPDNMGGDMGQRFGNNMNNQRQPRGDGGRRSRGSWKSRGRGRGR